MFMTCSTSYCLVTLKDLWNAYVYVCMCYDGCHTNLCEFCPVHLLKDKDQGVLGSGIMAPHIPNLIRIQRQVVTFPSSINIK